VDDEIGEKQEIGDKRGPLSVSLHSKIIPHAHTTGCAEDPSDRKWGVPSRCLINATYFGPGVVEENRVGGKQGVGRLSNYMQDSKFGIIVLSIRRPPPMSIFSFI